jgi:surface protein
MFWDCSGLKNLNVGSFDTSNVTNMEAMFYNCSGLTSIDLSNFDTSSVKNMTKMFGECSGLTSLELSHFDTSSVTDMSSMFFGCSNLKSLDLSQFDTSSVTAMGGMFGWCSGLTSLNLSGFDTSSVKSMGGMFNHCISLRNLDLSDFDVSNVTYMKEMFYGSNNLMIIKTPKVLKTSDSVQLSQEFYEKKDDGSLGEVCYTDLMKSPTGKVLETKVAYLCEQNLLSDKYYPVKYEDYSESPMIIDGKDMSWNESKAKSFWYENGIKQGTYWDPQGVLGEDPETGEKTIRGREICDNNIKDDNGNGTWFWLDSCYDGAKAVGKEVWVPYIYQQEDEWDDETKHNIAFESDEGMGDCVLNAIRSKAGKWVRYDENGRMLKGWVTIEGALVGSYPDQIGNTYYYDTRTGLMAKGWVTLEGKTYHFDEVSGVLVP